MSLFKKISHLSLNDKFFNELKKDKNINDSLILLVILSVWTWAASEFILNQDVGFLFIVGLAFFGNLILAFATHLLIKLMGAKKNYVQTVNPMIWGLIPQLLFSWIPVQTVVFSLAAVTAVLQIRGVSKLQNMNWIKVAVANLMPTIIITILFIAYISRF